MVMAQIDTIKVDATTLHVRGVIPDKLVAIIGTRKPSAEAADAAFTVAKLLAQAGISIISGLALGIDAAAHRGALAGGGQTVAVLGQGLSTPIYPKQHTALAEAISQRGALVSPYADDMPLSRQTLLQRNRWIAQLACAVWVVQTGIPGGALAAAAHAHNANIQVLCTPWPTESWQMGHQTLVEHGAESINVLEVVNRLSQLCSGVSIQPRAQGVLVL